MSLEDILKVLVDSRGPASPNQPAGRRDPMTDLIGGLLGGQQAPASGSGGTAGLGDMMGLLETLIGSGQQSQNTGVGQTAGVNDPIMLLLQPFVNQLARKMDISPQLATVVVSFVVHKLLAHHPTSGRDSTQFDLDDMLQQMSSGQISQQTLQSSGMVNELASATGLDPETAARGLNETLGLLGGQVRSSAGSAPAGPAGRTGKVKSGRKGKSGRPSQ